MTPAMQCYGDNTFLCPERTLVEDEEKPICTQTIMGDKSRLPVDACVVRKL
jgi:hypothetical protein